MATKQSGKLDYLKNNTMTPKMRVKWAYTAKPDDKFGKPQYKVDVLYNPKDKEQKAMHDELLAVENEYRAGKGKGKVKEPSALKEDKEGRLYFRFSSQPKTNPLNGDRIPLPIFDAKAQPCDKIPVFRDDLVRVAGTWAGWDSSFGTGVKLFLNSVQIIESNYKPGGSGANPFDEVEGGGFEGGDSYADASEEEAGTEEAPFPTSSDENESII